MIFDEHSVCITEARLDKPGPIILYVNDKFESLTGYSSEEVVGKLSPRILQGSRTDREVLKHLKECCSKGVFFEGTTINYRKDGTSFNMVWNINPIKIKNNIMAYLSIQQGDDFAQTIAILEKIRLKQNQIDEGVEHLLSKFIEKKTS